MLNLLLGNRLLAFFLLTTAVWLDRLSGSMKQGDSSEPSSRSGELLAGIAAVAWGLVLGGMLPAVQVILRTPEMAWIGVDSRLPLVWFLVGIILLAVVHRLKGVPPNASVLFWFIVAAVIADDRLVSWPLLTGGIHGFQPQEGVFGLLFLLYPIAAFSGRMGFVGRSLGLGLLSLGFGVLPASMLFFGTEGRTPHLLYSRVLGAAAVASIGMIGLEELGGFGRGTAVLIATGVFMILSLAGSKRSTEVRA